MAEDRGHRHPGAQSGAPRPRVVYPLPQGFPPALPAVQLQVGYGGNEAVALAQRRDGSALTTCSLSRLCRGKVCHTCSMDMGKHGRCCLICYQQRHPQAT